MFVGYFLVRFIGHGVFDLALPENRTLPIGPGAGIALVAVMTLLAHSVSAVVAATVAALGPALFLVVIEISGLLGVALPVSHEVAFLACLVVSVVLGMLARPQSALFTVGVAIYGPLLFVGLKFFIFLLGVIEWLFDLLGIGPVLGIDAWVRAAVSDHAGGLFVILTLGALVHLFGRLRTSPAATLFDMLAPDQPSIRKLFEFGGKAGLAGIGLGVLLLGDVRGARPR
jgi:hypothetical protein